MAECKQAACEGKVQFETFTLAEKALRHNEHSRMVYHCRDCNKFHIGTRLGKSIGKPKSGRGGVAFDG